MDGVDAIARPHAGPCRKACRLGDRQWRLQQGRPACDATKRLRLIIFDASRNNPFASGTQRTLANRRGLFPVDDVKADTMIAFAAKAGSATVDGNGPNSPYTTALLQHLTTPGLDVVLALRR